MYSPNNILFTATTALFDKILYPKYLYATKWKPITQMEPRMPLEDLLLEDNNLPKIHPQIPGQRDQTPVKC